MGFSLKEKINYYEKRVNDKKLTSEQRFYASSFLEGVEEGKSCYKGRNVDKRTLESAKGLIELNKRYNGDIAYFNGNYAVAEDCYNKNKK